MIGKYCRILISDFVDELIAKEAFMIQKMGHSCEEVGRKQTCSVGNFIYDVYEIQTPTMHKRS